MRPEMTTDARILLALRQSDEGGIAGTQLSQQLGISRAAIWARIDEMRSLGYEIEASPHRGYKLIDVPDVLHADDLLSRLPDVRVVGRDIRVFQATNSTNDVVEKLARDGVEEGVVVFAESQSQGRGRLGRQWLSPAGKGLWFSVLLRPKIRPQAVTRLTITAANALARAVQQQTGLKPDIKWPNDLLIDGRKVAGILTEMSAEVDRVNHAILGIGMDVNLAASEFSSGLRTTATSLKIASGHAVERAELAAVILRALDEDYRRMTAGHFQTLAEEWEQRCSTLGRQVTIRVGERRVSGVAESLDEEGALLLRTEHGRLERIIGGDVSLEK